MKKKDITIRIYIQKCWDLHWAWF